MLNVFVVCAPGLEPVTAQEVTGLGLAGAVEPGGVSLKATLADVARFNRALRTASRVLVRLGMPFMARDFAALEQRAGQLPWERFLTPGQPVHVRATSHRSRLYHTNAVAERVLRGLTARLGQAAPLAPFDDDHAAETQLIVVRIAADRCTVSVDSSGPGLWRRGYRLATAKAPLRETLAAALVLTSDWDRVSPLVDPFCGSGTIAIEAALLAAGIAPNAARRFAFEHWPSVNDTRDGTETTGDGGLKTAGHVRLPPSSTRLFGFDRDAGAIEAARANAERAGVAGWITFARQSISDLAVPPGPGWIVTNPPYGARVSPGHDLRNLYARFGAVVAERAGNWAVTLLTPDPKLASITHLRLSQFLSTDNGGLPVGLFRTQRE
jgi:putative N6-adenine-specific DNA methylase